MVAESTVTAVPLMYKLPETVRLLLIVISLGRLTVTLPLLVFTET